MLALSERTVILVIVHSKQQLSQVSGRTMNFDPRNEVKEERGLPAEVPGYPGNFSFLPGIELKVLRRSQESTQGLTERQQLLETVVDLDNRNIELLNTPYKIKILQWLTTAVQARYPSHLHG